MSSEAEPADTAQALREGADDEVDLVKQVLRFAQAEATRAEHTEGVCLVDQQPGTVALLDFDDLAQWRPVAERAVQALDDDQRSAGRLAQARQAAVEVFRVVVAKADRRRVAEPATIVDAGVAVGIDEQRVALASQRRQRAEVGLVAGRENDRRWPAERAGQRMFQRAVPCVIAAGHARSGGAGAERFDRGDRRGAAIGVVGQAEVIVGASEDHPAAVDRGGGGRVHLFHRRGDRCDEAVFGQAGCQATLNREFVEQAHAAPCFSWTMPAQSSSMVRA